jgi:hypothetical protein
VAGFHWKDAAINAGFSPGAAPVQAWKIKKMPEVQARIHELQENISRKNLKHIMSSVERKYRLTEFASANLVDFVDDDGNIVVDKNKQGVGALEELSITEHTTKDGIVITKKKIKLRDPIASIDLLNKMDKMYSEQPTTYNDYKIIVIYENGNERTNRQIEEPTPETG